ncbi:tyrosine--tRNA ligase [Neisseriaceae bacterium PsAf]|nr:tyrosine--tRNA ligase [Neisseriaceae bacterium PsAf]MCV2503135.1 tyrosine--tRNA ligase [Neisseriaceae bacterium]
MNQFMQEIQERGLIQQVTDIEALSNALEQGSITLYCGFDPTADSLHIGHLLPVLMLRRFQQQGHRPIALVGGATGMIGDPSFKAVERSLNSADTVAGWVEKIRGQLEPFLDFEGENAAVMANNADWTANINVLTFLRDIGKHFSVNAMMNKESVKQRLSRDDVGISFTEFAYSLLQAYDYTQLNKNYDCILQIGGSDQWGNITAGIDLTRRLNQKTVYGLTLPLVTKSDGTKFGKTEGGAVWLNKDKTSPYQFYQFWLKVPDADVYKFLKLFTFLTLVEIEEIEQTDKTSGKKPEAQRILAEEITRMVHGEKALEAAQRISKSLFAEDQSDLTESDFEQLALDGLPSYQVEEGVSIIEALTKSQLAKSNNEARTFIAQNSVQLNGKPIQDNTYVLSEDDKKFNRYAILRRGKRNHALLYWE